MKKISALLVITVISLSFLTSANAQRIRVGLKGGMNFSTSSIKETVNADFAENYTGFNAGLALNVRLILGFSIQPELIYSQTGMKFVSKESAGNITSTYTHGTIELPINIQWGIKLGPVRPYVQVSPYIGYSVLDRVNIAGQIAEVVGGDKFKYGMGLGFGLDIWKFQIAYKYKWDLKSLDWKGFIDGMDNTKIRASEISLAFFF